MPPRSSFLVCLLALVLAGCAGVRPPDNPASTPRVSAPQLTADDSQFARYGGYLKDMSEIVEACWNHILIESRHLPKAPSTVSVKFRLDRQGRVARIVQVESDSDEIGEKAAVRAITACKTYGAWTPDMVATLGDSQELTFVFYYTL